MFRPYEEKPKFNSSASSDLLDIYTEAVKQKSQRKGAGRSTRTFSPSGFRCERLQWFRIRGTEPDFNEAPDVSLDHMADIGTHIHLQVQSILSKTLDTDWIPVDQYLAEHQIPYQYKIDSRNRYETLIEIDSPPVRFACDGIIRINGKIYLLEIKTCGLKSLESLEGIKPHHIDQIRCYSSLLGIRNVLALYVDRQTGASKCFEHSFSEIEHRIVTEKMFNILSMARDNLAPPKLQTGDYMCSNCPYKEKCKEW